MKTGNKGSGGTGKSTKPRGSKARKPRSYVKRLKQEQHRNPMSKKVFYERLRVARRKDFLRIFSRVALAVVIVLALLFIAANVLCYKITGDTLFGVAQDAQELVEESTADDFRLAETTYIYSDDGTEIAELSSDDDATYLEYDEIPEDVVNAFVAVEDQSFWTNGGFDLKGILRVVVNYVASGGSNEAGASTITQQLARTEYLTREKSLERKIREIFIAREMTLKYTKEEIMEFYVNTCCFANGIYGIEDAAKQYFNCSASELDLSEVAYLCAIPNYPEYYNPYYDSTNAIERRDKILGDMYECGYITSAEYEAAVGETITVHKKSEDSENYNYETTYAVYCATTYLMELNGFDFRYEFSSDEEYEAYEEEYDQAYAEAKHELYTEGYTITTTIDLEVQEQVQETVNEQLAFDLEIGDDGIYELQGAVTVIDNDTGKVIAIVGGREQEEIEGTYSLNRAYQSYRQPGSTFKPIAVYTPALENGYGKYSVLKNISVDTAKEMNSSEEISELYGEGITMNQAVISSLNGCAYWLMNEIGPSTGLSYVTQMQFAEISQDDYTLSAALGGLTNGVTTVEMANAYATLEHHGEYTQTTCIEKIVDRDGNNIFEGYDSKEVYSTEAADTMTSILEGVITSGTASSMGWYSETSTEAAGKTGTTNESRDGWFCGYTPYYTIAVWVGYDNPKELEELYGSTYPAQIWKECMLSLIQYEDTAYFDLTDIIESGSESYDYRDYYYDDDDYDYDTEEEEEETYTEDEESEETVESEEPEESYDSYDDTESAYDTGDTAGSYDEDTQDAVPEESYDETGDDGGAAGTDGDPE